MRRIGVLLVAASALVACSDGGSGDAVATTTAPAATSPAPAAPAPVTTTESPSPTTAVPSATVADASSTTVVEPTTIPPGGGTETGPLEDADVQIETDEGTIQIGVAEVPVGVSDSFPIPPDLDVQLSSATDADFGFSGVSAMTITELVEFYTEGLTAAGYEITDTQEIEGVFAVFDFERGEEQGQVAISSEPGGSGSSVLVTIGDGSSRTEVSVGG